MMHIVSKRNMVVGRKSDKFKQIVDIYSQFSDKNKQNLVRTAQSLLEIQIESKNMISPPRNIEGERKNQNVVG